MKKFNLPLKMEDKVTILGHSGAGKSYLMSYMIDHYDFKPMIVFDTTHKFSIVRKMNHVGITRCKKPREGKICLKIHTPEQLEAVIEKLNNGDSPFFLVIDEIDRFTSPNTLLPETKLYLEEGRNWNRGGVFSVRRLGLLNKSIFANSHYLILFKINNKVDRDYLTSIVDINVNDIEYSDDHSFYVFDLYRTENLGEFMV